MNIHCIKETKKLGTFELYHYLVKIKYLIILLF